MIVDDQQITREGLKMLIGLDDEIKIISCVDSGIEAIKLLKNKIDVDIVLLDIRMPKMDGVETTKIIKSKFENIKIIILTTFDDDKLIFNTLKNGASTYMLKDTSSDEIIKSIKAVYKGESVLQSKIAMKLINASKKGSVTEKLTKREIEISKLISKGYSNKEIAKNLYITEGTVKNHISNILSKLSLSHRTQIALYVIENF
jgi:DNA-binding NarL/FixJ family response regulator